MEVGKAIKRGEDPFFFCFVCLFFFCFSLSKTTEICFGSTKMVIFYRQKLAFHAGKKIRKNDFAPSEKYACYTPVIYFKSSVRQYMGRHVNARGSYLHFFFFIFKEKIYCAQLSFLFCCF